MILEIAQIDVKPGLETEFEAGVRKAAPIFQRAKGWRWLSPPARCLIGDWRLRAF